MNRRDVLRGALVSSAAFSLKGGLAGTSVVETRHGKVRGAELRGVRVFRGIPYAAAAERFLPPTKPVSWTGIYDATVTGSRCVQTPGNLFLSAAIGEYFRGSRDRQELAEQRDSEDCLNLNVLTTSLTGKRPVMVYLHGGGFTGGSDLLTLFADAFPRENDIVLVGVNHRLNVFGYLYLGGLSAKYTVGNAGQLDLIAALEWVRANISQFGGDPANVTIFGESGGGGKVSTLLAMPAAKGLFHKAIVESGSVLQVATADAATESARGTLKKLGLRDTQVDELAGIPASQLLAAGGGSGPVVDGHSVPQQTWEPKAPGPASGIPMIIGTCKDESTLFSGGEPALFSLDEAGLRERVIKSGIPEADAGPLLAAYRRDHPKDSPTDIYFRISSDRGARHHATRQAELKVEQNAGNVFMYYFSWNTPCVQGNFPLRAFHTAELPLAMRCVRYSEAEQLSKQIAGAWAAFARTGSPAHNGLPNWPAYDLARRSVMIFDAPGSTAVADPDREERGMLRTLPSGRAL
jgi:para-nitrobenzyl esterase